MSKLVAKKWVARALTVLVGLLFTATLANAQTTTGNLQGVVQDPNKANVAGATVKVTNTDTGVLREVTTNSEGFYRVTNLIPGDHYKVEVTAQGYAPKTVDNVRILLATENTTDVQLSLASVTGNVVVTAEQPLIQSTQNQLSQSYSTRQLTQLPINGGLVDNLALLTPGVATTSDASFTNGVGISANGNRGRSNNFQIDGQDNNDNSVAGPSTFISNTEAVGEFQVITNNFSAEFGRNSGAQINLITKPGTNEFHGAIFEYLQNSRTDAATNQQKIAQKRFNFLANNGFPIVAGLANRRLDPYTYNRFGGAVGGPIKKNKAFFFATWQHDVQRGELEINNLLSDSLTFTRESAALAASLGFPGAQQILTNTSVGGGPAFVQGVGTLLVLPPLLDTTGGGPNLFAFGPGNPFGNPVTANRLSPSVFVNVGGVPTPLFAGEAVRIRRNDYSEDQIITREDLNLTSKDTVGIRYIYDNTKFPLGVGRTIAGARFDVPAHSHNIGTTYTRNISNTLTNEARFNFSRLFVTFGDTSTKPGPGIQFTGTRDLWFNGSLTFGTQNNLPQDRTVDVYQEQDTLSTTRGNHALKGGIDFRQQKVNNFFLPNFLGTYVFGGSNPYSSSASATAGAVPATFPGVTPANPIFFFDPSGAGGITGSRTGRRASGFENLLLGRIREVRFARGTPRTKTKQHDYFFFFQDDWRIRPNLTLNLGARYELSTTPFNPLIDKLNASAADPSTSIFDTAFPIQFRTATKLPLDKNNWAPRVGFAWSPNFNFLGGHFRDGKTVIRGGFGIAYDPSFFNIVLNTVTAAPFAAAGIVRQNPNACNPGGGGVCFPFLPSTIAQLNTTPGTNGGDPRLFNQTRVSPNFHNPYTMSTNFGIQQELWKNTVLEARYVRSRIVGQFQTVNGNPNVQFLNNAAQCLGLSPGTFSNGLVVGTPAATTASACANGGFSNNAGTNGDGRVDPTFGAVRQRINGASSTYNGLQLRFDSRLSNKLTLNANYSFSKTLDNASEIFSTAGEGQGVADPQRFFDRNGGERGLSAFHQKHIFNTNFIYDFPYFSGQRGATGHLLGGWEVAGNVRMGSGRPFTPLEVFGTYDPNFENAFFGIGALRPFNGNPSASKTTIAFGATTVDSILGLPHPALTAGQTFVIFDTSKPGSQGVNATAAQALQQARFIYNDFGVSNQFGLPLSSLEAFNLFRTPFGDVGRNTLTGLPSYTVNLALFKTTKLTERIKLEFRVEAANILNHRNFGVPDPITEDVANAFTVQSYMNPGFNFGSNRSYRFGARLIF